MSKSQHFQNPNASASFAALLERHERQLQEGQIVEGRIIEVRTDKVIVDIGFKSEGETPAGEFIDALGKRTAKVGDTVAAVAYTFPDEKGEMFARVEYLIIGQQLYGLRSNPA